MMQFEQIKPDQLLPADYYWLARGCEGSHDGATSQHQVEAAIKGNAFIFRVSGDMEGIFVLSVGDRELREVVMTALAGKGMTKHFDEFYFKVKELCKGTDCKRLSGFVSRPGLKRLYERRTQAKAKATLFVDSLEG